MTTKPKVCLIYTGGTIGMIREDNILKPPVDPSSFSRIAPEIDEIAELDFVPLLNKDSTNMTPGDWTKIANAVYSRMGPEHGYRGFVVAHGTDTMHFSASALAFAFGPNLNKPVVFTGSQTDASVLHGDARINLVRAVRVALEPIAEVVIAFGDFVFRGCRTQKRDERRFDAFESPAFYPIGDITEKILLHPIVRKVTEGCGPIDFRPDFESNIFQISLIPGLRPEFLKPLLNPDHCDGVILQSFGAGNVPDDGEFSFASFIGEAKEKQIPVVIASQFPANSTLDTVYEPGVKAIRAGAIPTGNMTNAAATAKFRWVLAEVRKEMGANRIRPSEKLLRIRARITKAYVDEMDDTKGQRQFGAENA
jgi:L-asparaginase